jgi:hypothetical protein
MSNWMRHKLHLLAPLFGRSYVKKVLQIDYANLIGYWPMNEASGAVAVDRSSQGNDGAYTGVTLAGAAGPDAKPCPYFDGANDYNDIYSAAFNTDFSGAEGTIAIWCKVNAAGIWTDGSFHYIARIHVDANNGLFINKSAVNNRIIYIYEAGGVTEQNNLDAISTTDWFHLAMTWSAAADEVNYYYNGAAEPTDTVLGVWAGNLDNTATMIGNQTAGSPNTWHGWLAHPAVWKTPLTAAQITKLATI